MDAVRPSDAIEVSVDDLTQIIGRLYVENVVLKRQLAVLRSSTVAAPEPAAGP